MPELLDLLHIQDNFRQITHRITRAFLKVVAADTDVVGGKKGSLRPGRRALAVRQAAHAKAMLMEATGGLVSRPEGFVIYLSTQSDEEPAGVFKEKLDIFRDVRDGKIIDPKKLGVLYEFPEEMRRARPTSSRRTSTSRTPTWTDRSARSGWSTKLVKAQGERRWAQRLFLAKHLNVEIGMNLRANRWPGRGVLGGGEDSSITSGGVCSKRCEVIVIPASTAAASMTSSAERHRPLPGDEGLALSWSHAWCHKGVLERRKSIASVLQDFAAAGELTIVGGRARRRLGDRRHHRGHQGSRPAGDVSPSTRLARRIRRRLG
jgi:phage terminase large subunit-like protein